MAGIYIHVPFCYTRCSYCDFYKTTDQQYKGEYIKALCKEIDLNASFLQTETIDTIYFGGGTPSTLSPSELSQIIEKLQQYISMDALSEFTLEVNPDDVTKEYIVEITKLGVNRVSMGIQSFFDLHLRKMNRRHNAEQAKNAIQIAQENGISNMSIDLIYGLPYMTFDEWKQNVQLAIDSNVQHISAYHLTIEKGTLYYDYLKKGKLKEVSEEYSEEQFKYLIKALNNAGFDNYEISNFAQSNYHSRHNSSYWTGAKYLGLGPSAHSFDGKNRRWNVSNLNKYNIAIANNQVYSETEVLSDIDRYNELVMLGLRMKKGFNTRLLKSFDSNIKDFFNEELTRQLSNKNLVMIDGYCCVAKDRILITDHIISDFFYVEGD